MMENFLNYQLLYMQKLQKLYKVFSERSNTSSTFFSTYQKSMVQLGFKLWGGTWQNPQHLHDAHQKYLKLLCSSDSPPSNYEKYYQSEIWQNSPYFFWIKDVYLKTAEWVLETIDEESLAFSKDDREKIRFITRQWIEALNPRNFPLTNPDVIKETLETKGDNFLKGLDNLIRDLENGKITTTDNSAFELGVNIATTKGSVIYRNKMMELIQYSPTTKNVSKVPLLIIPPWINKYYILDLSEENSFIKWLVDQGHTVFCISWANPDKTFKEIEFKDYMHDGALQALEVINNICENKKTNVIGYCIGGTLLAMTLAWLKGSNQSNPILSATFLTTLLDFKHAGDLKVFIDNEQLEELSKDVIKNGVMDGKIMNLSFSLLRASDLIWSFIINNYLLGREPDSFDLLYWNNDSTNLPANMHCDYLSSFYIDNKLINGSYILDGVKLKLNEIKIPAYFLSTQEDHIAPWKSTKAGEEVYGGESKFVLAGSGHIAGVINPPYKRKYGYEDNNTFYEGSWWLNWQNWVVNINNLEQVKASKHLGSTEYPVLGAAPGSYVLTKI